MSIRPTLASSRNPLIQFLRPRAVLIVGGARRLAALLALPALALSLPAAVTVVPLALPNATAPGGGTYSGINFEAPRSFVGGAFGFNDSTPGLIVGNSNALVRLGASAGTISGLTLASGQSVNFGTLANLLGSPAAGQYLVLGNLASTTPGAGVGYVLATGTPGAFTKLIQTGDALPGTGTTWATANFSFSPNFYTPTELNVTRGGRPLIRTRTATDAVPYKEYVGIHRNGAWEATQTGGLAAPGLPDGYVLKGTTPTGANAAGQFLLYEAATKTGELSRPALYLGQNGTLSLIAKSRDVLPGLETAIGGVGAYSINESGTVALYTYTFGSEGAVYRWTSTGGAVKVVARNDAIPSVGPQAVFRGPSSFQAPLINASGAMLFIASVEVTPGVFKNALLHQASPGAALTKIALDGEALTGLTGGRILTMQNSDGVFFNDAGQILYAPTTFIPGTSQSTSPAIFFGTAAALDLVATQGTVITTSARSFTLTGITAPATGPTNYTATADMPGSVLNDRGGFAFRASYSGAIFGFSGVFGVVGSGGGTTPPPGPVTPTTAQKITFAAPAPATYGDAPRTLSATADSKLTVTFTVVSGPGVITDGKLAFTGAGKVVVRASQAGDATYKKAPDVSQTFTVAKATLTVTVADASRPDNSANPALTLRYSGFVGNDTATTPGVLTKTPVATTKATASSPDGVYAITAAGATSANYTFVYVPGTLTVQGYAGTYETLLVAPRDGTVIGKAVLTFTGVSRKFTGQLLLAREAAPIALAGEAATVGANQLSIDNLTRVVGTATYTVSAFIDRAGGCSFEVLRNSTSEVFASGGSGRKVRGPTLPPVTSAGTYTLALVNPTPSATAPSGASYASVSIAPTGLLKLTGKLADGTLLTASLAAGLDATYRIYTNTVAKRTESTLAGDFTPLALDTPAQAGRYRVAFATGRLTWRKASGPLAPAKPDPSYNSGFGPLALELALDPWFAPAAAKPAKGATPATPAVSLAQRLGLSASPLLDGTVTLEKDPLAGTASEDLLPTTLVLTAKGVLSLPSPNSTGLSVKINAATGVFTGSFNLGADVPAALRKVTFEGILRQAPAGDSEVGLGYYLAPTLPTTATTAPKISGQIGFSSP